MQADDNLNRLYQVKFWGGIFEFLYCNRIFETWTHFRPGKPSSNFKFAQSYTKLFTSEYIYLSFAIFHRQRMANTTVMSKIFFGDSG